MRRGPLAAGCCAVLVLAGCGSEKSAQRAAVNRYFRRVDAVEQSFGSALTRAQRTLDRFGHSDGFFHTESYARAAATLAKLRGRVAAVAAPAPARQVRRNLLRLLDGQAALARELGALDAYLRATREPLAALRRSETTLRTGLAGARTARSQRRLFAAFARDVAGTEASLARISVPQALTSWHRAEDERLRRLHASAAGLDAALARRDTAALRRGLGALRTELAGRSSASAERAAIKAYDRRAAEVQAVAALIDRERLALERRLSP